MDFEEPPDPGDTVPQVGSNVTISNSFDRLSNESSGMDTETSGTKKRKHRSIKKTLHKMCNICNRKKRKHGIIGSKGCHCDKKLPLTSDSDTTVISQDLALTPVVANPVASTTPDSPPNSSSQAPVVVTRTHYDTTDSAPFNVHVQRVTESPNDGTTLHPIIFGKFLKHNSIHNVVIGSVKRIGRNRVSLAFNNHTDANAFISHESLNKNNLKAFIPTYNVSRMGVIRGVPTDISPEEIMECTTLPNGCGKILKVRRINFKEIVNGAPVWKPTQTVVVTFDGQVLPDRIYMCYTALQVQLYTYPTIQCYNCCRFGHTKLQCRSKPRCFKCGQEHSGDSCDIHEDSLSCCSCGGAHYATSKSCPEYTRQTKIKHSMADKCISYAEASRTHPPLTQSYAAVLTTNKDQSIPSTINQVPSSSRKTVFLKPRLPLKSHKGYDQRVHRDLTSQPLSTQSNGCALKEDNQSKQLNINDVIALLTTLLQSNIIEPSNVAKIIDTISILHTHNGSHQIRSSVELQECSK